MTQASEDQIKVVEGMAQSIGFGRTHAALTALLTELHETRELLEAADTIDCSGEFGVFSISVIPKTGQYSISDGNGTDLRSKFGLFNSVLDAWAEVKKQGEK